MRDTINIGSSPYNEPTIQIKSGVNYLPWSIKEIMIFREQLKRQFPRLAEFNCYLHIRQHPHDFGTYAQLEINYNSDNEKSRKMAYTVDGEVPAKWDDIAQAEIDALKLPEEISRA